MTNQTVQYKAKLGVPFYHEKGHLYNKINYGLARHSRGQLSFPASDILV